MTRATRKFRTATTIIHPTPARRFGVCWLSPDRRKPLDEKDQLSLHDALPILAQRESQELLARPVQQARRVWREQPERQARQERQGPPELFSREAGALRSLIKAGMA